MYASPSKGALERTRLHIDGDGLSGEAVVEAGQETVEVPVAVDSPVVGQRRPARVHAGGAAKRTELAFDFAVAEPGWTVWMVSHFHYDPVWWNTQAAYTERDSIDGAAQERASSRPVSTWSSCIWRPRGANPSTSSCWQSSII